MSEPFGGAVVVVVARGGVTTHVHTLGLSLSLIVKKKKKKLSVAILPKGKHQSVI